LKSKKRPSLIMPAKISIVNVRLPSELVHWIDSLVDKRIYNSRSEAIRDFSREYVIKTRGAR
jgi:Arc/MetJ-type ribon-helix-helix transcriptional regulator